MAKDKDWIGSSKSVFKTLASSHHAEHERQTHDYYATEPRAVRLLLEIEQFSRNIWEPACGEGHMSIELEKAGYTVSSTDLIDRGFGQGGVDFFAQDILFDGDIITNPPYKYAKEFVLKAHDLIPDGRKIAMFLPITFLEGLGRRELFKKYPLARVWISSGRINCAMNGNFEGLYTSGGSARAYGWFIWEKGYQGDTVLKWFN